MRDFRDAKAMARALRDALKAKAIETTHAETLELIAKAFGYENWNILSAKIEAADGTGYVVSPLDGVNGVPPQSACAHRVFGGSPGSGAGGVRLQAGFSQPRCVAVASNKNIENNPMQSSRRAPATTLWG